MLLQFGRFIIAPTCGGLSAALCCCLLTGCAQLEAQRQAQAMAAAQAQLAADDAQCKGYGAEEGTPIYIQCRMNLDNQRAQAAENNRALAMQYLLWHR